MEEIEQKDNVALVEPPPNTALDQTMNRVLESTLSKTVQGWMTGKEDIEPGNANSYKMFDVPLNTLPVNQSKSSLSLQMCLYFDLCFLPVYTAVTIYHLVTRQAYIQEIWYISFCAAVSLFLMCHPARIYLGYMGNMKDSLQHIACFWLFTIVPSLLLSGFLFIPGLIQNICPALDEAPLEGTEAITELTTYQCNPPSNSIVAGVQFAFLVIELGLSFRVGRRIASHSKETRDLHQFIDIIGVDPLVPPDKKIN